MLVYIVTIKYYSNIGVHNKIVKVFGSYDEAKRYISEFHSQDSCEITAKELLL